MPELNSLELLQAVRETNPDLPFILYTGRGSEEIASEAISAGVTDYVQKEASSDHYQVLANSVENAIAQKHATDELRETNEKIHALHETAISATTCDTRGALCELAVEAASDILEFDLCAIDLEQDGELVPVAVSEGTPSDMPYSVVSVSTADTLDARAYRHDETVLVNDLGECECLPAELTMGPRSRSRSRTMESSRRSPGP